MHEIYVESDWPRDTQCASTFSGDLAEGDRVCLAEAPRAVLHLM